MFFYLCFNEHNNQVSKHEKKKKIQIQRKEKKIFQIHNIKNRNCLNIIHS
jgi:hypothetical protein